MRELFTRFISVIPFVMIWITLFCAVCSSLDFYTDLFKYLPDMVGYSIITNVVFLYHYSYRKYCIPTRAAVWGLFIMNLVSITTSESQYYNVLNDIYICSIVLIISVIFKVRRW